MPYLTLSAHGASVFTKTWRNGNENRTYTFPTRYWSYWTQPITTSVFVRCTPSARRKMCSCIRTQWKRTGFTCAKTGSYMQKSRYCLWSLNRAPYRINYQRCSNLKTYQCSMFVCYCWQLICVGLWWKWQWHSWNRCSVMLQRDGQ